MNRFIKECLTVASGLCAIGLVLVIIGGIFGGFRQTAAIALNGGFVYPIYLYDTMEESTDNESSSDFQEMSDGFYENDDVCDMSDVEDIFLETGACEVIVSEWEGTSYKVEGVNVPGLKCYEQDGTLYLKGARKYYRFAGEHRVTLYVPKGASLLRTEIDLGAGKGTVSGLNTEELDIQVGAGELNCENITADLLDMEVDAGKADFNNCDFEDVCMEVNAGSLTYDGKISGDADISCTMGSAQFTIDGSYGQYNYDIEATAGTISVSGQNQNRLSLDGMGEKTADHDADSDMRLECTMGNTDIIFE